MRFAAISTRQLAVRLHSAASPSPLLFRISTPNFNTDIMAKATSKKQNNRADPLAKKGKETKTKKEGEDVKAKSPQKEKDPKQSHLYTDDNPETTLHGTGFKDAATANNTIDLVSKRSLTYQWQTINTMYNRAKHHPKKTKDIEAAVTVFEKWLKQTYPKQKAEQRTFKPLLSKKAIESFLPVLNKAKGVDTTFAEVYVNLEARKRLANVLVNDKEPGEPDWDKTRVDRLSALVPSKDNNVEEDELWTEDGDPSEYHLSLVAWAWSPVSEYRLLKALKE